MENSTTSPELEKLREQMNRLDEQILQLFALRDAVSIAIGKFKKKHALAIEDVRREKAVLAAITHYARQQGLPEELVKKIYSILIEHSKEIQFNV